MESFKNQAKENHFYHLLGWYQQPPFFTTKTPVVGILISRALLTDQGQKAEALGSGPWSVVLSDVVPAHYPCAMNS